MISYCANPYAGNYCTMTGTGVPDGKVMVKVSNLLPTIPSRDGEIIPAREAHAYAVEHGLLIEFRSTASFDNLCRHYIDTGNMEAFERLCGFEEVDVAETLSRIARLV